MNMRNLDSGMQSSSNPPHHEAGEWMEAEDCPDVPDTDDVQRGRAEPELGTEQNRQTHQKQVSRPHDTRRWQITKEVLREHGLTPGCKGCEAHRLGHTHQTHTNQCRERLESSLADIPRQVQRIEASRVRVAQREEALEAAPAENPEDEDGGRTPEAHPEKDDEKDDDQEKDDEKDHDQEATLSPTDPPINPPRHDEMTRHNDNDGTHDQHNDHDDTHNQHERGMKRQSTTPMESLDPRATGCTEADGEMECDEADEAGEALDVDMLFCDAGPDMMFCDRDVDVRMHGNALDALFVKPETHGQSTQDVMFCTNAEDTEWDEPDPWWSWDRNDEDWGEMDLELKVPTPLVTAAKKTELDQLQKMGTWKEVPRSQMEADPEAKKIDTRWVLVNKGTEVNPKVKARLVAKEFRTKSGGESLFSGTPGLGSIKLLLSDVATQNDGRILMIADVTGAFLYGRINRRVYVTLPAELPGAKDHVGLLEKSLYGLRDAPQIWKRHLVSTLSRIDFTESPTMPGVLRHRDRRIWIVVHVDDLLCSGYPQDLEWLSSKLKEQYELKTQLIGWGHESEGRYLKRTIRWEREGITWTPNEKHCEVLIAEFGLEDCNTVRVPVTSDMVSLETRVPMDAEAGRKFRSAAARVNYLAQDRPDLAVASCLCAARMASPKKGDEAILKKIARYLRGAPNSATRFRWQDEVDTLTVMTDSDWATCPHTRKSKSGGAVFWGAHCLGHWCKVQDRIARSSGEAELKSACKGMAELLGLAFVVEFLRGSKPKLVHCIDANATIGMMHREGSGTLKHLHVRTLWVQEAVREYSVDIKKIPRNRNCADALCSMPRVDNFKQMMRQMGLETAR